MRLLDLFVRPARFFATPAPAWAVVLAAWVCGMASTIDRAGDRLVRGADATFVAWPWFWALVLGLGALSGAVLYWVGGWWYGVRVGFCGVARPDRRAARRLYIFSSLVAAAPAVLVTLAAVPRFEDFRAAAQGAGVVSSAVVMAALVWSIVVSYRGVVATYSTDLRLGRARLWFVALPLVLYAILFIAGSLALLAARPA